MISFGSLLADTINRKIWAGHESRLINKGGDYWYKLRDYFWANFAYRVWHRISYGLSKSLESRLRRIS